ncbi:uncharacterized protein THITE_2110422 [Thermothielavioides terrestris NRRL 8126]|uniref:Uncharacterized protein n=1 Tax=Thermothielavioides terrestris (strain ATCC 38088 / NRRL 8126) TaxID=578455 RepID=G2QSR9_THETT|nr:uncharacterized protein THITE_2110422 [Thermothielavioides terrestris NRRL 8126]AEO64352.1 hypothetical protein THITE_2110422 [Thermothielavioides terrestris NRRL 8126]
MPRLAERPQRDLLSNNLWHFYSIWNRFQKGERGRDVRQQLIVFSQHIASFRSQDSSLADRLETRQDQARAKLSTPNKLIPAFSLIDCCNQALNAGADGRRRGQLLSRPYHKASRYLTIGAGIVYAAARLTIIALLFTTLRSVPEGVYTDTPWTRFLPNIS